MFLQGDIFDVELGTTEGHEQANKRPCVIIRSFENLKLSVIVPFTSKEPKSKIYTIVKILKDSGGLNLDSYALCHQIRTVSFDRIKRKYGRLDIQNFLKIHSVLIDMLGFHM